MKGEPLHNVFSDKPKSLNQDNFKNLAKFDHTNGLMYGKGEPEKLVY